MLEYINLDLIFSNGYTNKQKFYLKKIKICNFYTLDIYEMEETESPIFKKYS